MTQTGYLAADGFEKDLEKEISLHPDLHISQQMEKLFLVEGPIQSFAFAQNTWKNLKHAKIESISQGAKLLKEHGKLWAPYSHTLHRRMSLIQEQLPKVHSKPMDFPTPAPHRQLGAWTMQDEKNIWFSSETDSPFALGEVPFVEDKSAPSRAYLKLWEFFTVTGRMPKPGDVCMDLGSSPGGWTWVLSNLGCQVISVDKAPLAPELLQNKNIKSIKKDAFTLQPADVGPVDWLFSDIICYPHKLLELVQSWRTVGAVPNLVCTIKFQGETDFEALKAFRQIPGSEIRHLFVNKHEVTWSSLSQ
ncbi:MAG: SAM-dependent methyltransferase [Pseudobdellovibrionaceae bacterium]